MKTIKIDDRTVNVDGIIYERKEPQFKVGQWVIINNYDALCSTHEYGRRYKGWKYNLFPKCYEPMRIIEMCNIDLQPDSLIVEQFGHVFIFGRRHKARPATHDEIEEHLIKVKDQKYKNGATLKSAKYESTFKYDASRNGCYDLEDDEFWCGGMIIYHKGKWAEILPEKKRLPKTKEEYEEFIEEWRRYPNHNVREFVNQYE